MRGNPYDILCLDQKLKKGRVIHPFVSDVREAWLKLARDNHPDNGGHERHFRDIMTAGNFLLGGPGERYREQVTIPDDLVVEMDDWSIDPIPSWFRVFLAWARERMEARVGEYSSTLAAAVALQGNLDELPDYTRPETWEGEALLDTMPVWRDVARKIEGAFRLMGDIEVIWRRDTAKSKGKVLIGKARKYSTKERSLHPYGEEKAPRGCVELCLAYWIVACPEERERLLAHELLHFEGSGENLRTVDHDVTTFVQEQRVYGLGDTVEGRAFVGALNHPRTSVRLQTWDIEGGQLSFLSPQGAVVVQ